MRRQVSIPTNNQQNAHRRKSSTHRTIQIRQITYGKRPTPNTTHRPPMYRKNPNLNPEKSLRRQPYRVTPNSRYIVNLINTPLPLSYRLMKLHTDTYKSNEINRILLIWN